MKNETRIILLVIVIIAVAASIWLLEGLRASPADTGAPLALGDGMMEENGSGSASQSVSSGMMDEARQNAIKEKQKKYKYAPEFQGIASWINSGPLTMEGLHGKVVLVDFWTYSCINCLRTLPYIVEWDQKYRDKGLVIVGVHTPEFSFEKDRQNVVDATLMYNITYPVAQDNDYATWTAYGNRYWPRKYLVDTDGFIRYDHIGEGGYAETEKEIQTLLNETGVDANMTVVQEQQQTVNERTPELYLGINYAFDRGQNLGNAGGFVSGNNTYAVEGNLHRDVVYLNGMWEAGKEQIEKTGSNESSLLLSFIGRSINFVLGSANESLVEVRVNGMPVAQADAGSDLEFMDGKSYVRVREYRLYNLFNGEQGRREITLSTTSQGLLINAITFG